MKIVQLQFTCLVLTAIFLTGCSSGNQLHTSTKPASVKELRTSTRLALVREKGIPELKGEQTVNIQNYYSRTEVVGLGSASDKVFIRMLEIGTDGYNADLKQFTDTAIVMLSKALEYRNIKYAKTGQKQVKLRAHSVKYNQGAFSAVIEVSVTAELRNDKSITAWNKSSADISLAASASAVLSYDLKEILNHHDFIEYINQ